jgi:diguanylate cyclase (GGDEF)-like protein
VADTSATFAEIAIAIAYPMLDIVLLGVLTRVALAPGPRVPAMAYLLGAMIALLAADFAYAFVALSDGYHPGHPVEAGWLISSVLWAAAAFHPSMRRVALPVTGAEVRFSAWRLVLLATASLMAPVVLVIQWTTGSPIDVPVIAAGSIVLFLLVIARMAGVVRDLGSTLTQQKRLEKELERRALHDPLTGLANRVLFADRLEMSLARRDERVAVMFLDLDDFKTINDTQGHQAGDELLVAVAEALRRSVRPEDTVARLGGDEFAVLMQGATEGIARRLAERLHAALRMPMRVAGQERTIGVSIGISMGQSGVSVGESLMREADIAMYVAKGAGKGGSSVFDPRTHAPVVRGIGLGDDLERAIAEHQFELQYQPIVAIGSGELAGVEALVRWRHPVRGLLGPRDFIPVAESTGLIIDLGKWIFSEACRQAVAWSRAADGPLSGERFMSINLSTVQLTDPKFLSFITDTLSSSSIKPRQLMLEVTESANPDSAVVADTLRRIHDLGVRLAIDDFGTGFASMSRLADIPFEIIKIDISLVAVVDTDPRAESVVTGITDIARRLGAMSVAEGVERVEQLAPLRRMGCDLAQGFHFSRSLPAAELEALLTAAAPGAPITSAARVPRPAS